tara:strand:- start:16633 stop:17400 length:768 start_codon:yes stop_codon:yes gene_type:complete
MNPTVSSIHFSPIKSLSFQSLNTATIKKDIGIEEDRIFAFSRAINFSLSQIVEKDPNKRELIHFLTLKNTPFLNKYDFKFENEMISISKNKTLISTHLFQDKKEITKEISKLEPKLPSPIFLLKNELFPFYDTTNASNVSNTISLINLNSIKDFEQKINKQIEFERFRGNIYLKDLVAFEERNWINKVLKINSLEFKVLNHIPRCSATNIKINSDQIDINLPNKLKKIYGHMDMGIYLHPLSHGKISVGDQVSLS